jgi:hypothetical protein
MCRQFDSRIMKQTGEDWNIGASHVSHSCMSASPARQPILHAWRWTIVNIYAISSVFYRWQQANLSRKRKTRQTNIFRVELYVTWSSAELTQPISHKHGLHHETFVIRRQPVDNEVTETGDHIKEFLYITDRFHQRSNYLQFCLILSCQVVHDFTSSSVLSCYTAVILNGPINIRHAYVRDIGLYAIVYWIGMKLMTVMRSRLYTHAC